MSHYRQILHEHFQARCERNRYYSLRAFARDIEIFPSDLSKVLRGVDRLSPKACQRIARALKLDDEQTKAFIDSVFEDHKQYILGLEG